MHVQLFRRWHLKEGPHLQQRLVHSHLLLASAPTHPHSSKEELSLIIFGATFHNSSTSSLLANFIRSLTSSVTQSIKSYIRSSSGNSISRKSDKSFRTVCRYRSLSTQKSNITSINLVSLSSSSRICLIDLRGECETNSSVLCSKLDKKCATRASDSSCVMLASMFQNVWKKWIKCGGVILFIYEFGPASIFSSCPVAALSANLCGHSRRWQ